MLKDLYLSRLLIKEIHEQNAHVGREHSFSLFGKHFWIVACRGLIKKILSDCINCCRQFVKPNAPCMGNLPKERLYDNAKSFSSTSIDYFGAIKVKATKYTRKNSALNERYDVIFVCLTMRALHLEVADNLTTESFILALSRFIARRGHVKSITSDYGSNFIGGEYELRALVKDLDNKRITQYLNSKKITWKFNPPLSPWMGGSWESLIKSLKRALRAISTDRIFTDETLRPYLCEVESILNKHPLTPTSNNIHDFEAITPNHLLIGYQSDENSFANPMHYIKGLQNHCKTVQSCANMFWNCWRNYYLPTLTSRTKWTNSKINLSKNDLAIIKSNDVPRSHWPLSRILDIYPGSDGVVRSKFILFICCCFLAF